MNALGSRRGHSRYLHIHYSNKNLSTDELQLSLTLEPTTIQVVKTSLTVPRSPTQWDGNEMDSGKELFFVELNMVVMQVYMYNLIDSGHFPPSSFSLFFNTFALYLRYLSGNP